MQDYSFWNMTWKQKGARRKEEEKWEKIDGEGEGKGEGGKGEQEGMESVWTKYMVYLKEIIYNTQHYV